MNSEALTALLPRVEPVLWTYDGLKGAVIKWTFAHENENHDPSVLCWLVHADGTATATLQRGGQYQPAQMAKWLGAALEKYERAHPRTRVPLVRGKVIVRRDGTTEVMACKAFDAAREAKTPTLVYFGRDSHGERDKVGKREAKRARTFEKKALGSKKAGQAAEGWTLLRFDLADANHKAFAATLGVKEAPTLLLYAAGVTEAQRLGSTLTGPHLARLLVKGVRAPEPATE